MEYVPEDSKESAEKMILLLSEGMKDAGDYIHIEILNRFRDLIGDNKEYIAVYEYYEPSFEYVVYFRGHEYKGHLLEDEVEDAIKELKERLKKEAPDRIAKSAAKNNRENYRIAPY